MVNNVGKTTTTLNTTLGGTTDFTSTDDVTIYSGTLSEGFLISDDDGTLGVVTYYNSDTDEEERGDFTLFTVTTEALSLDLDTILNTIY